MHDLKNLLFYNTKKMTRTFKHDRIEQKKTLTSPYFFLSNTINERDDTLFKD